MNALVLLMAVIRSAPTLLDHTPVTATQDIDLLLMEENVTYYLMRTIVYIYIRSSMLIIRLRLGPPIARCIYTGDDVDECTVPDVCHQVCTNTEGSFTCGCEAGYVLDSEGASCSGIK